MRLGNGLDRSLPQILEIIQINGNIGTKRKRFRVRLFHDIGPYRIKSSALICRANQWTGLYMIGTTVMKELKLSMILGVCNH